MTIDEIKQMDKLEIVKEISLHEGEKNTTLLAVVKWFDNKPTLEKRSYWKDDNGKLKCGKSMGLRLEDLKAYSANEKEILELMA